MLEVGAGTGKLTRVLVDEFAEVVAVEPDPHMRSWFTALCPRAALLAGAAEALPVAQASVDAVFVAEAFHWFDHQRAVTEIARVLRPGGALVLMWNRPAGRPEPPITAVENLLEPLWPKDIDMPLDLDPSRFAVRPRMARRVRALGVRTAARVEVREYSYGRPRRARGVLRVDGLDRRASRGRSPSPARRGAVTTVDREYRLPFETDVHWTRLAET